MNKMLTTSQATKQVLSIIEQRNRVVDYNVTNHFDILPLGHPIGYDVEVSVLDGLLYNASLDDAVSVDAYRRRGTPRPGFITRIGKSISRVLNTRLF